MKQSNTHPKVARPAEVGTTVFLPKTLWDRVRESAFRQSKSKKELHIEALTAYLGGQK